MLPMKKYLVLKLRWSLETCKDGEHGQGDIITQIKTVDSFSSIQTKNGNWHSAQNKIITDCSLDMLYWDFQNEIICVQNVTALCMLPFMWSTTEITLFLIIKDIIILWITEVYISHIIRRMKFIHKNDLCLICQSKVDSYLINQVVNLFCSEIWTFFSL